MYISTHGIHMYVFLANANIAIHMHNIHICKYAHARTCEYVCAYISTFENMHVIHKYLYKHLYTYAHKYVHLPFRL